MLAAVALSSTAGAFYTTTSVSTILTPSMFYSKVTQKNHGREARDEAAAICRQR